MTLRMDFFQQRIRYILPFLLLWSITVMEVCGQGSPQDTIYRIQIKENYGRPLSTLQLMHDYGLDVRVREFYYNGYYTYTIYFFNDLYEAIEACFFAINNIGIPDARIIMFVKGKRVAFNSDISRLQKLRDDYKAGIIGKPLPEDKPVIVEQKPEKIVPDTITDTIVQEMSGPADRDTTENLATTPLPKELEHPVIVLKPVSFERRVQTWLVNQVNKIPDSQVRYRLLQFSGNIFHNTILLGVIFLIFYFLILSLIFSAYTMFMRFIKNKRKYKRKKLEEKYHEIIADYLYKVKDANIVPAELFRQRSMFRKKIIIDVIVKLYVSLEGDVAERLRTLYLNLRYNEISLAKIKSRHWHIKAKGFKELATMDVSEAENFIRKFLNSRNDELRSEAHIAMVRLNKGNPFGFLDKLIPYFTPWEQLNVHYVVKKYDIEVPQFMKWFHSPNDTIVIFCLKMVIIFKQNEAAPKLPVLLDRSNDLIREQAIIAVGELSQTAYADILKKMYPDESLKLKVGIIKALQRIPDERHIEFFKEIIATGEDFSTRLEAARALYQMGPMGKTRLRQLMVSMKPALDSIYNHVTDTRI